MSYALSLPVHCVSMGCTTIGQIEDDARIAQQFRSLTADEMAGLRKRAQRMAGPRLENWKRNTQERASIHRHRDGIEA